MSFQTDDLTILALGILNDDPADPDQPKLADGNHLRWAFAQEKGFPLHGFYLLRREHRPRGPVCLSPLFEGMSPGIHRAGGVDTPLGRLDSGHVLVLTDDFAPGGTVEADGREGLRFSLPAGVEAGSVEVRIGFRDPGLRLVRTCIDFRRFHLGTGPSPRIEKGVVFDVEPPPVSPWVPATSIEEWSGAPRGLVVSRRTEVGLPCAARKVDLLLTNRAALRIEALDANGTVLATRDLQKGELTAGLVTLNGEAITQVVFQTPATEGGLLHEICFECPTSGDVESEIEVRALAGTKVVASKTVRGSTGQTVSETLAGDAITVIEISPGPVALIDLCFVPTRQGVTFGWQEVPGFEYPLCLPVAHEDYACPGRPATFEEARTLALSRVTYPGPKDWQEGFDALHDQLAILVDKGPAGGPMADRKNPDLAGIPESPATQSEHPKMPGLRALDLILLASLHPTVAQMVGLYFVDQTVEEGVGYDYILFADPTGVLGGSAESALAWLAFSADPSEIDAAIVLDRKAEPRPQIAPPGAPRAYALPGMVTRKMEGDLREDTGNVGLWWPPPADPAGDEEPDRIVFYYPKRIFLGTGEPAAPPAPSDYKSIPELPPVLVSEPDPPVTAAPPISDWPQPDIPLHVIDSNLAEGWYSYRLSGQDLFGRRSPLGLPSEWYQWKLPPETQAPWYYKPSVGHGPIHSFAVALLDKVPPPTPLGVEAWALDPDDRWVLEDEPYNTWRKDNEDLIGLRVRWRWTLLQQIQAPDTREFRIYYQPGRWNALLGRTVKVAAASATESDVELDFASSHSPGTFAGTRLRVGNNDFKVLGSQPGARLRLRVKNIGVHHEISPAEGKPCTIAIPEKHKLWVDTGLAKTWAKRLSHANYDPPARIVIDPSKDANGRLLTDEAFKEAGLSTAITITGKTANLPPEADLSGIQPWIDHLWLEDGNTTGQTHRILGYDVTLATVTLETAPTLGSLVHWKIGRPAREYDVFLPAPDVGEGNHFEPSLAEPTVFAQIAISAADDKIHVKDDSKWGDPERFGNESRLSPSATVYRVLQKPPQAPELPKLPPRLYATPADYHDRSYSTFRFIKVEHLRVHILRALDDSLFQRDWIIRDTRKALDPVPPPPPDPKLPKPKTEHLEFFPDGWGFSKRDAAAKELNKIDEEADYANLSKDAWEVLALLPGNEGAAGRKEIFKNEDMKNRDWLIRRTRKSLSLTLDAKLFPNDWDEATREAAITALKKLNDLNSPAGYLELKDDGALRVLAGLPGNEAAFTQVTLQPFEMADTGIEDGRRPDDDAEYTEGDPDVRAYTDALPGRATNRYFYRASFVDGAQNQSALSLAGPPVYLHDIEPPRAPVITKVIGGERKITIRWAKNHEPDLARYNVYRTGDQEKAGDIRSMQRVAAISLADLDPGKPDVEWTDRAGLTGGEKLFYRLTATDTSGNESAASRAAAAVVVDTAIPPAPVWTEQTWFLQREADNELLAWPADGVVPPGHRPVLQLGWQSETPRARFVVERQRRGERGWTEPVGAVGSKPEEPDTFVLVDPDADPAFESSYRLKVRSSSGVWSIEEAIIAAPPPVPPAIFSSETGQ